MSRGRPTNAQRQARRTLLTYEEMANRHKDTDRITVHYDGIEKSGHWYEDHMMNQFNGCKLVHLTGNEYQVAEWPQKGD